ncbi:M15 family metallopeptidase [Dermacoccus sp. PE3]|uniref:M15 family metallopeptidase n=1 Tax=Dermacoccus sp. PE3 TaxID=1641401 RepID=UPI002100F863|nr:M15 family metallopeptidase [Dermacoccus sp. PE3]
MTTQQKYAGFLGYPRAARPGTSNHGMGVAIDLETRSSSAMSGTPYRSGFGGPYDTWITAHGKEYGWDRPAYLDRNGSNPESWHYNFIG